MKRTTQSILRKAGMTFLIIAFFALRSNAQIQTMSMSAVNCIASANELQFDVTCTNTGPYVVQFNSAVIRMTHSPAILASGTNALVFVYLGNSDVQHLLL